MLYPPKDTRARVRTLCRTGLLAALYVVLTLISVRAGNLRITFASLPVAVAALLFDPVQAMLVAMLGEGINQLLSYGLTATTLLWLAPPMLRGLAIGLAARRAQAAGRPLDSRPALCTAVFVAAALLTTAANTLVIWLDSVLYGYYSAAYVFGATAARLLTGVVTAVLVALVALPVARFLRSQPALLGR